MTNTRKLVFTSSLWMLLIIFILINTILIFGEDEFINLSERKLLLQFIPFHYFIYIMIGIVLFAFEYSLYRSVSKELKDLSDSRNLQLLKSMDLENQLSNFKQGILHKLNTYFSEWKLSDAECDVALLILKGFSFKEIGELRKTKEKTIREQAMKIYAKSGLKNRSEFLGFFLIELINE